MKSVLSTWRIISQNSCVIDSDFRRFLVTLSFLFLQRGVQIAAFCKDFNALTAEYKPKVPMIADIKINVKHLLHNSCI
jgi:hypothetical protein